jgi:hypothetical protein
MHQRHTQIAQNAISHFGFQELLYHLPTMDNGVILVEMILAHIATDLKLATNSQPALLLLCLLNRFHYVLEIVAEVHWVLVERAYGGLHKLSVFRLHPMNLIM